MNKKIIFVGAKPDFLSNHPGGQSTAAHGLISYLIANNIHVDIIDSAQQSFPIPSFRIRLFKASVRSIKLIFKLTNNRYLGAVIFSYSVGNLLTRSKL